MIWLSQQNKDKNNFFEFNNEIKQQISDTTIIGTKFTPPYTCIHTPPYTCTDIDKTETGFLKTQMLQPFVWLRYIENISFI